MRKLFAVLVLAGCGGAQGPCGGDPAVRVGQGDGADFVAFTDGDSVPVDVDDDGTYRFVLDTEVAGLDPAEPVSAVVRIGFGSDATQDFLGMAALTCTDAPASYTFVTPFQQTYQDPGVMADLDGTDFSLRAAFTDATGVSAETVLTLRVDAP